MENRRMSTWVPTDWHALRSSSGECIGCGLEQPKWGQKGSKRASFLDIATNLRIEIDEASVSHLLPQNFAKNLVLYADT